MLSKSNIFLKKLPILFILFLIFGNTVNSSLAAVTKNIPAESGKAIMGDTVFYPLIGFGHWKKISTTGGIYGNPESPPPPGKPVAYTFGGDDIKITYNAERAVQAMDLRGHKSGDIVYFDGIKVGSIVDTNKGDNKLNFRTRISKQEFDELLKEPEFTKYLSDTKDGFGKLVEDNPILQKAGSTNEEIFEKLYVLDSSGTGPVSNSNSNSKLGSYITLTGKGAKIEEHGFNASPNDYSSLGHVDLKGLDCWSKQGVIIDADNKKLIHLGGTEAKPNFIFDREDQRNTAMLIKTPLQLNEWSLKGFNKIELDNARLELIETRNINFTPPLDKMNIDYKGDDAGLVLGVNATGGKIVTLKSALEKPKKDDQYIIGFRSTTAGGMLPVDQKGHNIGASTKRYKELVLDGPGGLILGGSGEIHAKRIVIKDNGDEVVFNKKIDSGADSLLHFDGNRKLRILQDLSISKIDLNGKDVILSLENGRTIKSNIHSTGTGQLFATPDSKVSGNIDNIKDIIIRGSFTLDGDAKVKSILLDSSKSNLIVADKGSVKANEIKSFAAGTRLTFLGRGKVVSPNVEVQEIHSNGHNGAVAELEGYVTPHLLQYLHANTVKVTGHFNPKVINFNDKKAILELVGNKEYEFNPISVKEASNSTLKIFGIRNTENIKEILKINEIKLGDRNNRGALKIDVAKHDVKFPNKTIIELAHRESVLFIENSSKKHDRVITLTSPLATLKPKEGIIVLESLERSLTLNSHNKPHLNITDEPLQRLVIKGKVSIDGGHDKVRVDRVQHIDIDKDSKFSDFGGTSLLAKNISVGGDSRLRKDAAHYTVGIDNNITVPETTKLNLRNSWSTIELRNVVTTTPKVTFDASIENAENAKIVLKGGYGMHLHRTVAQPAFTNLREVETHGIVVIPRIQGFDISNAKKLDIVDGKFQDHTGKSVKISNINIGNAAGPAIYELDAEERSCCIDSKINFGHRESVFMIHNDSAIVDRTVTLSGNIVPGQDCHSSVIKKSVHKGKTLTIGEPGKSFGDNNNRFKEIVFCGDGKLDIRSTVHAANIQLDVPEIVLVEVNAGKINFLKETKYQANGNIKGDVYFNSCNGELTLADGKNIQGSVYNTDGSSNSKGTVIFSGVNGSSIYGLGKQNSRLALINFANSTTVGGDAYADSMSVGAGKIATFVGTSPRKIYIPSVSVNGANLPRTKACFDYNTGIGSNNLTMDQAGKARFNNAVLIDAPISQGQLEFIGDVWLKQKVSGVGRATFAKDQYVFLEKGFEAASIVADGAKLMVMSSDAAIRGQMNARDFGVDLGNYSVRFAGNKEFTGIYEIYTMYNCATKQGGNIVVESGSDNKIDFTNVDQIKIKLVARSDINDIPPEGQKYKVILSTNGLTPIDINKIVLDASGEQNKSVTWTIESFDNNNLTLQVSDNYTPIVPAVKGSEAYQFYNDLNYMTESQHEEAVNRLSSREAKGIDSDISPIITGIMNQVNAYIDQRAIGNNQVSNTIGAGDCDKLLYGLWVTPFYSEAKQKMLKGVSGYKAKSLGAVIGFDTLINDQLMVGAAYSRIETKLSHRDIKQGDKTKGATDIYALYGLYNLQNSNWFGEGIASYGTTRVKNSEGRVTSTAMETAYANYRSNTYGGQLLAGYDYQATQQVMITPLFGGRYSRFEDLGYTEYGTRFENLTIQKRKYSKIEGVVGIRGQALYTISKMLVIPEIHGYVNYDFQGNSPLIDARLDGMYEPLPTKSSKPSRAFYIVGAGLTAKLNNSEYGGTYNCNIADKYLGHQISMKFRLNF